jgi:hypothetical protein
VSKQYIFRAKLQKRTASRAVMLGLVASIVLAPTAFAEGIGLTWGNAIFNGGISMLSAW